MGDNGLCTPPHPKSPPEYPDACGKHRLKLAVQALNQEIDYLQRELSLMDGTVPASRCCKELHEYVRTHPDPLIKVYEKRKKCCIWNIFRGILCCNWGCICCTGGCPPCPTRPKQCCLVQFENIFCCKRSYIDCTGCNCCKNSCCNLDPLSGPCVECSCGCVCSCFRCAESCVCPRCTGCCKALCIC